MLSIIVPVYNVEQYLDRCFQSIDAQTFQDYEVIVVNDGSTDNSLDICHKYADHNPKYHLYSKENGGLMSAWMYAVERASGDYFGFVDSDDYIEKEMYQILMDKIIRYNVDIAMCRHFYENSDGIRSVCQFELDEGLYSGDEFDNIKYNFLPRRGKNYISPSRCSKVFKRKIIEDNIKFCDTRISSGEDVCIVTAAVLSSSSFYFVNQPLYVYCVRGNSISGNYKKNLLQNYEILLKCLVQIIDHYSHSENTRIKNYLVIAYAGMFIDIVYRSKLEENEKILEYKKLFSSNTIRLHHIFMNLNFHELIIYFTLINRSILIYKNFMKLYLYGRKYKKWVRRF